MMITFNCTVQEGAIPDHLRPPLAAGLARVSSQILGGSPDDVSVTFTQIPHGFGFRGGALSTTSTVRGRIPPGCDQPTRVRLMQAILDLWQEHTGCASDEVVVSARDRQPETAADPHSPPVID